MIDFLTWTAFGVFAILALTIAAFRIIEAHEHTKAGVFDLVTREAAHD